MKSVLHGFLKFFPCVCSLRGALCLRISLISLASYSLGHRVEKLQLAKGDGDVAFEFGDVAVVVGEVWSSYIMRWRIL